MKYFSKHVELQIAADKPDQMVESSFWFFQWILWSLFLLGETYFFLLIRSNVCQGCFASQFTVTVLAVVAVFKIM